MVKRKTLYQSKKNLERTKDEWWTRFHVYLKRKDRWERILEDPSSEARAQIAHLLAALEFNPDEDGRPQGALPSWPRVSPLAWVNFQPSSAWAGPGTPRYETLEWKADVFRAATLVWAGVIELQQEAIYEVSPLANVVDVNWMLQMTDIEAHWRRRGKSRADIRTRWENGDSIVDMESLRVALARNKKGY